MGNHAYPRDAIFFRVHADEEGLHIQAGGTEHTWSWAALDQTRRRVTEKAAAKGPRRRRNADNEV